MKKEQKFCSKCGAQNSSVTEESSQPPSRESSYVNPNFKPSVTSTETSVIASGLSGSSTEVSFQRIDFPEESKSDRKPLFIGLGVFGAAIALLLIFKALGGGAQPVTVTIEMTVIGQQCSEITFGDSWGYSDIPGGQVLVKVDESETFVGEYDLLGTTSALGCKFRAIVSGVKSDGQNYSVSMASGRRGTVYSTRSELESNDWTFTLSLGKL